MRSQGQVRFVKFSSRAQMTAAAIVLALALGWASSMAVMAFNQYAANAERATLLDREALVSAQEEGIDAFRDELATTTGELEARQEFLESMVEMLPDDMAADQTEEAIGTDGAAVGQIGDLMPAVDGLARIEARQLAFVARLTRYAELRAKRAEQAIRTLGLDPRTVLASNTSAMGGPFERLASDAGNTLDPRFERLGTSLAKMSALERGLDGIPQFMPADVNSISSGFGYRRDPFNGSAAMHSGLDFSGPNGAPIYAAAVGRVRFVGVKSGYGNVVEIDHGAGVVTRYAHMSRFDVPVGRILEAGTVIGGIGSTGRSTGPHLHFEVRINGRAVNPRPFLETAPHVLEQARANLAQSAPRGQ